MVSRNWPSHPTTLSSVCFFISGRKSSAKMNSKRFLCSRFRTRCLWNVWANIPTKALECFSFPVDTLFHFSFGKKAWKESSYKALNINFQFGQLLTVRPLTKKKKKTTHSSTLAWEIPRTEKPCGLYSPWSHRSQTQLSMCIHMSTRGVPREEAKTQSYSRR